METNIINLKSAVGLPEAAADVYEYVKTMLVQDAADIQEKTRALVAGAEQYAVITSENYEAANAHFRSIALHIKGTKEHFAEIKQKADKIHKGIVAAEKEILEGAVDGSAKLSATILHQEQEWEKERKRREAELAEQLRKQEEERILAEAQEAQDAGLHDAAQEIIDQPVIAPIVMIPSTPKVAGVGTQRRWVARLTDKTALIKAVAAGKIPDIALDVNMPFFNRQATSYKERIEAFAAQYPGVVSEEVKKKTTRR
jgi:hypothetical protein